MSALIFDKYEIQHRLAVGGMGEVFYAVQHAAVKGFERPVILKNLLPDLAQQEGFIEQFLDEARVAATLNHPNVVSIYEVGLWNGTYFIAMEFIRGRNLSQLVKGSLKKNLPIPPAVIARVIRDAALGLDHAHSAKDGKGSQLNIVHRDISPQNIMVRDDGVTKVVDFGIARASNRSTRTATGALKGKLAYMAPEQVLSRNVTGLADQFALGVVLWEMCTRRRLFHNENDLDLIKMVMESEIPRPSLFVPGLPEELDEIALRMMQRDAKNRYANIADVARELESFLVKFSPPSSESPVAAFVRLLGPDETAQAPARATPSGENFVISLNHHPQPPRPPPDAAQGGTVTSPSSSKAAPDAVKRRPPIALLALLLIAVGGVVAFAVLHFSEPLPPPAPVEAALAPAAAPIPTPGPEVKPAVAAPEPEVPAKPGALTVVTTPSGASVRLDGRKKGETPLKLEVPAGQSVHLQLEKTGFAPLEQDATVEAGESKTVELKLVASPHRAAAGRTTDAALSPSAESGFLSLDTTPWTRVSVDGDPLGSTPLFKKKMAAGHHTVLMETEAGVKVSRGIDIKPGNVTKLQLTVK